ncbi:MAG: HAMP domain-containing sensor histidine kinase [Solirubrobacteraceae bacterium]
MSFRRRITIVSAAAVAIAVVLASILTYVLTSGQLHSLLDTQLRDRAHARSGLVRALDANGLGGSAFGRRAQLRIAAERVLGSPPTGATGSSPAGALNVPHHKPTARPRASTGNVFSGLPPGPDQVRGYQQMINANGAILIRSAKGVSLPVDAGTRALAAHGGKPFFRDANVNGIHLRVLAESLGNGHAVQFAQPLTEVDSLLARLRLILALLVVGGIALAAVLGRLVAGAAVQPLKRLTNATEHVALTRDLSGRIKPSGDDELGRLASSFNEMLDALERSMNALDASVHAQRQLVADASHELRTPVTSLRTNIEILQQQGQDMDPEESRRLLGDVVEQIEELTLLMNDLIDLARGEEPRSDAEELRLDLLVTEVVERARRHAPATPLQVQLEPTIVTGVPARLERAVGNLIDNAVKYSPPSEPVEIRLQAGELSVRDHGPGISTEDLPHIFDRFYRGAEARGRPGSGLGLAIVQQVAAQQGGSITAEPAPGGGTLMCLRLPGAEVVEGVDDDGQRAAADGELAAVYDRSSA